MKTLQAIVDELKAADPDSTAAADLQVVIDAGTPPTGDPVTTITLTLDGGVVTTVTSTTASGVETTVPKA